MALSPLQVDALARSLARKGLSLPRPGTCVVLERGGFTDPRRGDAGEVCNGPYGYTVRGRLTWANRRARRRDKFGPLRGRGRRR